ncbi:MAG: hypothetical protein LDL30_10560 [Desulfovibrio sp.]|nr:hypothetical protein [Desulfovibrio sp.]MCA1986347.1 hypothetical protein [Desulfovibrio sp.]
MMIQHNSMQHGGDVAPIKQYVATYLPGNLNATARIFLQYFFSGMNEKRAGDVDAARAKYYKAQLASSGMICVASWTVAAVAIDDG